MARRGFGRAFAALAAILSVSLTAFPSCADTDLTFYRGRTITYLVATPLGSGHDVVSRLVAAKMERFLPGAAVIIKNVPGDHQLVGANAIFAAKADGLTIGTFSSALIYSQLMGTPGAHFDLRRMSWIGKVGANPRVMVVPSSSPITAFRDLRQPGDPFVLAVPPVGSTSYYEAKLLQAVLKLNMTVVSGYMGDEEEHELRARSVDAAYGPLSSYGALLAQHNGRILFYVGGDRRLALPLTYLTRKDGPVAEAIVDLIETESDLGRVTVGPPGIPDGRLEALRTAYRSSIEDTTLQAESIAHGYSLTPFAISADVARRIDSSLDQSPQTIALIDRIFGIGKSASNY